MPFMNLSSKCQTLKDGILNTTKVWHIYSLRFESLAGTQRYERDFVKNQRYKIKDSGEPYAINYALT